MNVVQEKTSSEYQAPTLESLSAGQIAAIRKIPPHNQAAPKAIEATRPASIFLDAERYRLEQERLFRRLPMVVTLSSQIPEPGSVMAHDGYGVPLLVVRDLSGRVRCFLNACMHKGAKLVHDCEPQRKNKVTCPYHAWTFALDGSLVTAAREELFKNLDKDNRGLAELPCRESGGLVWVILDKDAKDDFSEVVPEFVDDMDALGIPSMHLYGRKTFNLKANWKLVLEPFLEGYHVQRLHARSVGPLFADVPNVTDKLGAHIRQISGKVNFTPDVLDIPGENIHKSVTHAYQVFPNTVVVTSPYYISIMMIMPNDVGETTVDYHMLTHTPAYNEKVGNLFQRSYEMILDVFGNEDFWAAEMSHEGLASGALDDVVYCGLEATIPLYYETLERYLD